MQRDYYLILEVPENASTEQLQAAYRRRARLCHPDHGGSHAAMVELNEAYFVLRDPMRRAEYNRLREKRGVGTEAGHWQQSATKQRAKAEAQEYPRDWAQFEKWLSAIAKGVTKDVGRATYSEMPYGTFLLPGNWPTAGRSWSGWLFIVCGLLAGLGLAAQLGWVGYWLSRGGLVYPNVLIGIIGPSLAGAWLGRWYHECMQQALRDDKTKASQGTTEPFVKPTVPAADVYDQPPQPQVLLHCPKCDRQLRVPALDKSLAVTCPSCKHQFDHLSAASASSGEPGNPR